MSNSATHDGQARRRSAPMPLRPLLALPDYQRIYQVAFSVLEASGNAATHRACIFFASVGTLILREHYSLPATISAGCLAIMIDERQANVVVYGREEDGVFVNDNSAFHVWVTCDGWLIDFMAPIMGVALRQDGGDWHVPRRMLQKRLVDGVVCLDAIQHAGDFFVSHDAELAASLLDNQSAQFEDLLHVCRTWFRRPPKPLKAMALADSRGQTRKLVLKAPSIDGVW